MITIVDYGMGNLGSVKNMFKRIGVESKISSEISEIDKASKLLLPGVGSFDAAMTLLNSNGFKEILDHKVLREKTPILGICLGMQLLTRKSEEGLLPGLGWISADTIKFNFDQQFEFKIPHMGWNSVNIIKENGLTKDLMEEPKFYFVHSYKVHCDNSDDVIGTTNYGANFHSMISHENIYGAQFHPEKSHKYGMQILQNFAEI